MVFDQMPPFVGFLVELGRKAAVGFRRDDWCNAPFGQRGSEPIGIEGAIREQVICGERVDQLRHAAQVMRLPRQQAEVDKVAKRVGQGNDLSRHAAARGPYGLALSPPFAPWPERWTLTMEPSIIAYSKSASAAKVLNML